MTNLMSSANGTRIGARTWQPRPCRPSSVDPTVPELLRMADGTRKDWRSEPTARDLRVADQEIPALLAEFGALYMAQIKELESEGEAALMTNDRVKYDDVEKRIDAAWDAVGHLALGN